MSSSTDGQCPTQEYVACYRRMLLIRYFEEGVADLFARNLIGGTTHLCIGQEACAVGVVSETRPTDCLVSHHRGHGHLLARGLDPVRVLAELMGRQTGYCGGRGGSQHLCAMDHHFLGTNGITGGGIPIATGAALALKHKGLTGRVVLAFFGDGATNQGTFHESLNMASLWRLPVLYVCENNGYAMSMPVAATIAGGSLQARATAFAMPSVSADGMDLSDVKRRAAEMLAVVRAGNGPALLELRTYRHCGHSKNDPRVYRTRAEEADWQRRDCLTLAAAMLESRGLSTTELAAIQDDVRADMARIMAAASASPYGNRDQAVNGVYA